MPLENDVYESSDIEKDGDSVESEEAHISVRAASLKTEEKETTTIAASADKPTLSQKLQRLVLGDVSIRMSQWRFWAAFFFFFTGWVVLFVINAALSNDPSKTGNWVTVATAMGLWALALSALILVSNISFVKGSPVVDPSTSKDEKGVELVESDVALCHLTVQ